MHWSQVSADISLSRAPDRSAEVLTNISTPRTRPPHRRLQPAAQALSRIKKPKLAECRGQGDGPVCNRGRPSAGVQGRHQEAAAVAPERFARAATARQAWHLGEMPTTPNYDAKVAEAVRKFQESASSRPPACSTTAPSGHQQPEARPRQIDTVLVNMGALALAAAPARRGLARQRLCLLNIPTSRSGDAERPPRSGTPAW